MSHNPNETTEHIVSNMINWSDKVIKSQHELNTCNDGKRSSDVLLSTIEELERTKKQLDIAFKALEDVATFMTCDEVEIREIQPEFCAEQAALDRVNEAMKKIKEIK